MTSGSGRLPVYLAWVAASWVIAAISGSLTLELTPTVPATPEVVLVLILLSAVADDIQQARSVLRIQALRSCVVVATWPTPRDVHSSAGGAHEQCYATDDNSGWLPLEFALTLRAEQGNRSLVPVRFILDYVPCGQRSSGASTSGETRGCSRGTHGDNRRRSDSANYGDFAETEHRNPLLCLPIFGGYRVARRGIGQSVRLAGHFH